MLRVLDICSGVGRFSAGLEATGGFFTTQFVEINPKARMVLTARFPGVPIHDDIATFSGRPGAWDAICAGIPCQPHSSATRGRRRGVEDDRFLWPELRRVNRECGFVDALFLENVAQFDGVALDTVVSEMEADGYEVPPIFEIPACAVGLDHHRPRLWICGYANRNREPRLPFHAEVAGLPGDRHAA
jgi:DNA (cytosine-5)-methyltransferase 1